MSGLCLCDPIFLLVVQLLPLEKLPLAPREGGLTVIFMENCIKFLAQAAIKIYLL